MCVLVCVGTCWYVCVGMCWYVLVCVCWCRCVKRAKRNIPLKSKICAQSHLRPKSIIQENATKCVMDFPNIIEFLFLLYCSILYCTVS